MRKYACGLVLLLLVLAAQGAVAQEEAWYMGKPIANIVFTGLDRVRPAELEGIIKPFINKPLSNELYHDLQRRLYEMEEFEYVEAEPQPYNGSQELVVLAFNVVERPGIDEVAFEGNTGMRSLDLLDEITLRAGKNLSPTMIAADEAALRAFYLTNGYANVRVSSRTDQGAKANRKKLVFVIDEGFKTSVRKIQFTGLSFASEGTLKTLLKTAEQSLFNVGLYQAAVLERDKESIIKYYRENGYVDARIVNIEQTVEKAEADRRDYLTITIQIEEGQVWKYGGLTLNGNLIFSTEELLALTKLKAGAVMDTTKFQADFQAIADRYYKDGYINNSIRLAEQRDSETSTISYTVNIVEYGRAYVEDIIVKGNTKTKDEVILRELPIEEGDVFSSSKITQGLQNLYSRRFFSNIEPETPAGSAQGLYDLVVNVTEQNTTNMSVGMSLSGSNEFPLSVIFNWSDSNFLGNGQEFGLEATASFDDQKLVLSFSDPWLFGYRWGGGASLKFERQRLTGVAQDLLYPVFDTDDDEDGSTAVPDPFTGAYVFSDDQPTGGAYEGYVAGDYFPGVPTDQEIATYNLVTDYEYAGGSSGIPADYAMEYINWEASLSLNTSFRRRTLIGWVGLGASASSGFNYVEYDPTLYRPFDQELRDNLNQLVVINRIGLTASLDNRDLSYDPSSGYLVSQGVTFTGGILAGARHYIRTDSTLQFYLTLWNLQLAEDSWLKTVLAMNSTLSLLHPQFFVWDDSAPLQAAGFYLYTSPNLIARGWPMRKNGEALFNNWIELRTPLVPGILSFDLFGEIVRLTENRDDIFAANGDWMCGFGAGFRLTMQQLPLRLYVGKRFSIDGATGEMEWQKGNLFADTDNDNPDGIDIMLTFSF